jgi:hypothetical protein
MPSGVHRVHSQRVLLRNQLLLTRMRLDECRGSKGHVCDVSVGNHIWQDCVVAVRWRGCLPVAIRTCLSESRCISFCPMTVRPNRNFRPFLEAATIS